MVKCEMECPAQSELGAAGARPRDFCKVKAGPRHKPGSAVSPPHTTEQTTPPCLPRRVNPPLGLPVSCALANASARSRFCVPQKKGQKMDLNAFLADTSTFRPIHTRSLLHPGQPVRLQARRQGVCCSWCAPAESARARRPGITPLRHTNALACTHSHKQQLGNTRE